MKIRGGFISNSSSSSFVLFASKEAFETVLAERTEAERNVLNQFIKKDLKFCGKDVYKFSIMSGNYEDDIDLEYEDGENDSDFEEREEQMRDLVFGKFDELVIKVAKERGEEALTDTQDF